MPAILEYLPVPQGRRHRRATPCTTPTSPAHGYAVRARRPPRHRRLGRDSRRRVPASRSRTTRSRSSPGSPRSRGAPATVGMIGISWGGFNGLQVAARRPPALRAVITLCSTDDRYADDVHYIGGCVLAVDMLPWASAMLAAQRAPPDPAIVGDAGARCGSSASSARRSRRAVAHAPAPRRLLAARLGLRGLRRIECRRLRGRRLGRRLHERDLPAARGPPRCPRKGLIGPWAHAFPSDGVPGPAIGFLQECLRWWDRWLKGVETGVMDEPMLRAWMQEPVLPAQAHHDERPGRWVSEASWPARAEEPRAFVLDAEGLRRRPATARSCTRARRPSASTRARGARTATRRTSPSTSVATTRGRWTFDRPAGRRALRAAGQPIVALRVSADRPRAFVAARLCDVAPDGASTIITRGFLNLCHPADHGGTRAPDPAAPFDVPVRDEDRRLRRARGPPGAPRAVDQRLLAVAVAGASRSR